MVSQALIITGMHRSGTSLVASILQAAGVDIGEKLLVPGPHNRKGYFEDARFYDLSRRILTACCSPGAAGFHEIGWMEGKEPDFSKASAFADEALDLIAQRLRGHPGIWGWKDPRTTLLLNFWDQPLPEAKYIFVYRPPWSVVESFLESEREAFKEHPDWPARIWSMYNRRMLDFIRDNRKRAFLASADAVAADPSAFVRVVDKHFDLSLESSGIEASVDVSLLRTGDHLDPFPRLFASCCCEEIDLLRELESEADLPGGYHLPPPPTDAEEMKEAVLRLHAENRLENSLLKEARWDAEQVVKEIEAERAHHRESERLLEEERSAHIETRARLDAEAAAHAERVWILEGERSAHAETRSKLDAEAAAHAEKARLMEQERADLAIARAQLEAYRAYLATLRASRLWRLRAMWFGLRRALGIITDIEDLR